MNKSDTGSGGRGSYNGDIIGTVINHGKKHYWARDKSIHYHVGLKAGENTLEAQLTRLITRSMLGSDNKEFSPDLFREQYI